jgi:hypothetical protein
MPLGTSRRHIIGSSKYLDRRRGRRDKGKRQDDEIVLLCFVKYNS